MVGILFLLILAVHSARYTCSLHLPDLNTLQCTLILLCFQCYRPEIAVHSYVVSYTSRAVLIAAIMVWRANFKAALLSIIWSSCRTHDALHIQLLLLLMAGNGFCWEKWSFCPALKICSGQLVTFPLCWSADRNLSEVLICHLYFQAPIILS